MIDVWFCFFCKQETSYELRISGWGSHVCSSDQIADLRGDDMLDVGLVDHLLQRRAEVLDDDERLGAAVAQLMFEFARGVPRVGVDDDQIGRASCRERVCQYVSISVVAVSLKKHQRATAIDEHNDRLRQIK